MIPLRLHHHFLHLLLHCPWWACRSPVAGEEPEATGATWTRARRLRWRAAVCGRRARRAGRRVWSLRLVRSAHFAAAAAAGRSRCSSAAAAAAGRAGGGAWAGAASPGWRAGRTSGRAPGAGRGGLCG